MIENRTVLSASRIKLFSSCSWCYYSKYVLKLNDKGNEGTFRGTIVHLVLECLLNKRHKKHFDLITSKNDVFSSTALTRLVLKHAKKTKVDDEENLALINEMILVALKCDFYCQGSESIISEEKFELEFEDYSVTGYIDKIAIYPNGTVGIFDYKTSKNKFTKDEIDGNLQALMYSLACYKIRKIIPAVNFLFLRFPRSPKLQITQCSLEELKGYENYLAYMTDYLSNFTLSKATCTYAFSLEKTKWLCGFAREKDQLTKNGKKMFCCSYKFPFNYYSLVDKKTGEPIAASEDPKQLEEKEGTKIIYRKFHGCPAWGYKITKKFQDLPKI